MRSLMPLVFPITGRPANIVGRTPWSAAGPLAGLPVVDEIDPVGERAGPGGPARTGGPPHNVCGILRTVQTSGVRMRSCPTRRRRFASIIADAEEAPRIHHPNDSDPGARNRREH